MIHISNPLLSFADKVLRLFPVALIWRWCARCNVNTGHSRNESRRYPGRVILQCDDCGRLEIEK